MSVLTSSQDWLPNIGSIQSNLRVVAGVKPFRHIFFYLVASHLDLSIVLGSEGSQQGRHKQRCQMTSDQSCYIGSHDEAHSQIVLEKIDPCVIVL